MRPVIIDTDIGTDIDDALAIAYGVRSGLDIKLISTVHGDTLTRARIAKKLTQDLLGVNIPIVAGEQKPIKQTYIYWTGLEGKDFLNPVETYTHHNIRTDGVNALAECIETYKHNIDIVSIGPLTNIARLLEQHSGIESKINHLYVMGNALECEHHFHLNYRAHNFKVDPEAVDIVMNTTIPKTIVTTQVCKKIYLTKEELTCWQNTTDPLLKYLSTTAQTWMNFINYDCAYLYDPLVVHHAIDSSITSQKQYEHVSITSDVKPEFKETFLKTLQQK